MAEFKFGIISIETDLGLQSVFIECSLDVNPDTVTNGNVFLMQYDTKRNIPIDIIVEGNIIQLQLREWAVPNEKYTIIVESGIESIVDNKLEASLMRNLEFKSEITSTMQITSPANFEHTTGITEISFKEKLKDDRDKNKHRTKDYVPNFCYYLEIAKENAFYNVIYRTFIDKSSDVEDSYNDEYHFNFKLKEIEEEGQYYIRIRAQEDEEATLYGKWSPVVTFLKQNNQETKDKEAFTEKDNTKLNKEKEAYDEFPEVINLVDALTADMSKYDNIPFIYSDYTEITPTEFTIRIPEYIDINNAEFKIIRRDT